MEETYEENDIRQYDLNPNNYDINQIYDLLNIDSNNKNNLTLNNIRKSVNNIIQNLRDTKKFTLIKFVRSLESRLIKISQKQNSNNTFNKQKVKITNNLRFDTQEEEEEYEEDSKELENTDISDDYMLLPKKYFKDTIQSTDDIYKKDNPEFNINKNYSVPGLGSVRQNIKNIATRTQIININSKYRKNNYLSSIVGYNLNKTADQYIKTDNQPSVSSVKTVKNNLTLFDTSDFTVTLSESLNNVVSIRLYSIAIPFTFYNISTSYGNNSFYYKVLEKIRDPNLENELQDEFNSEDQDTYNILILQDGQYFSNTNDEQDIYKNINNNPFFSKFFNMFYDKITGKTKLIVFPNVERFKIIFYRRDFAINNENFRERVPGFDTYINKLKQIKCNTNAKGNTTKIDTSLGHLLGFRNLSYNEEDLQFTESRESLLVSGRAFDATVDDDDVLESETTYLENGFLNRISDPAQDTKEQYFGALKFLFSESLTELFGTKYFVLSIDDFQKNNFNNSIISLESAQPVTNNRDYRTNIAFFPDPTDVNLTTLNDILNEEDNLNDKLKESCGGKKFIYLNKTKKNVLSDKNNSLATNVPSLKLPRKLIYSLNAVKETAEQVNNSPELSEQISRKNILGIIPIRKSQFNGLGEIYTEFGGTLQNNERLYTGPVDLQHLNVKLFNDNGQLIDLNNHDWSFSLVVEHQYQY